MRYAVYYMRYFLVTVIRKYPIIDYIHHAHNLAKILTTDLG